jgi:hypothetical protein
MDDVALANYIAGCFGGPVEAGRIDTFCADLIGVSAGTAIWFSDYTLEKLRRKHGDINFSHYRHMPAILLRGFVARGRRPNELELWWVTNQGGEKVPFFVALKATRAKEVYVGTFHRINLTEARRRLRRAKETSRLVREQPYAAALLKGGTGHVKSKTKKEVA